MEENKKTLTPQEQRDEQMISEAFQRLLDTYLSSGHRGKKDIIIKAFNFAKQAHKGVRRLSGEPYILHPIAVAQIVCQEIGLGSTSICAALLHDVEEDTDYTNEDISNLFGPKVANIVEGLTKIAGGIFGDRASLQAETFKKLLLTMSDDIRVILIKIADRLHNMRTLSSMLPSKQYKISGETLYIYAPIADRLGLNRIKTELEDLSFKYEHPAEYQELEEKLAKTQDERDKIFNEFTPPICTELDKMGIKYTIKARVKSPYSIWNKMQKKHIPFEEVFDVFAIRIVFVPKKREEEINECFNIYVALSKIYKSHPDRFRDWLNHPKANGYQALHVTLMSHTGQWIEVQIRSDHMDDVAEQGYAAHWKYKNQAGYDGDSELNVWLNSIKEILDDPQPDTLDFLDAIKLNLFASEILVFTPKGEIKTMPANSTVLDFAFSIHTFLGSHFLGAKVNHKLVPISYHLKSGDQVEVLSSNEVHVQRDWINYAHTAKAKAKIQALLRRSDREKQKQGEQILTAFLKQNDIEPTSAVFEKLEKYHSFPSREEFFLALGEKSLILNEDDINCLMGKKEHLSATRRLLRYIPFIGSDLKDDKNERREVSADVEKFVRSIDREKILVLNEDNLSSCILSKCCNPIPGDEVLGYITPDNQLEIHKRKCSETETYKSKFGNRIIAVDWNMHRMIKFVTTIYIKGIDAQGMLCSIADVIHRQLNISVKRITIETQDGIFEGQIDVYVYDTSDVAHICDDLRQIDNVTSAIRID